MSPRRLNGINFKAFHILIRAQAPALADAVTLRTAILHGFWGPLKTAAAPGFIRPALNERAQFAVLTPPMGCGVINQAQGSIFAEG